MPSFSGSGSDVQAENPKIREAMNTLLRMFDEENLEKVAHAVFRGTGTGAGIPSDKWSFLNRVLMYLHGTEDARGFKQWKEVGRYVKKGSKAFYIIGPVIKNKKVRKSKAGSEGEDEAEDGGKKIIVGFRMIPVFRFEDTDGAPVIREEFKVEIPCEFDKIIQELGLKVVPVRFSGSCYGSYNLRSKVVELASPDLDVFLHELSHAVDDRLNKLKPGQQADQEVSAEFSAAVIGYLMGYRVPLGNVKEYIESYSYSFKELMNCLGRIEKIVGYVLERTAVDRVEPIVEVRT